MPGWRPAPAAGAPLPQPGSLEQTALLRSHRERLLRQGRLYLLTGAAAREECRQAVCPDADPRKIRRLGERLIAQEFARGESGTVREGWLTAVGAARTADRRRLPRRLAHPAAGGPLRRLCP